VIKSVLKLLNFIWR